VQLLILKKRARSATHNTSSDKFSFFVLTAVKNIKIKSYKAVLINQAAVATGQRPVTATAAVAVDDRNIGRNDSHHD